MPDVATPELKVVKPKEEKKDDLVCFFNLKFHKPIRELPDS